MEATCYTGEIARKVCNMILATGRNNGRYDSLIEGYKCKSVGFWKENGKWIAYDNTNGCCWVEEFPTRKAAVKWIEI